MPVLRVDKREFRSEEGKLIPGRMDGEVLWEGDLGTLLLLMVNAHKKLALLLVLYITLN
jgi:hypothetical protein